MFNLQNSHEFPAKKKKKKKSFAEYLQKKITKVHIFLSLLLVWILRLSTKYKLVRHYLLFTTPLVTTQKCWWLKGKEKANKVFVEKKEHKVVA